MPAAPPDGPSTPGRDGGGRGPDRIEWHPQNGRLLFVARHAFAGAALGLLGSMFLASVLLLVLVALGGSGDVLILVTVLVLVGGPFSLLYLVYAATYGDLSRLKRRLPGIADLDLRLVALASPLGLVLLALFAASPPVFVVAVVIGMLAWTVVSLTNTEGSLDPGSARLVVGAGRWRREHDLRKLTSYRTVRLGSAALVHLRYDGMARIREPLVVAVDANSLNDVRAGLDAVLATEWDVTSQEVSRPERTALVAFGGLFVVVAALVAALGFSGGEGALFTYPVAVIGGIGVVFLALAWVA